MNKITKNIIAFRKHLHSYPELSGNESNTLDAIIAFISKYSQKKSDYKVYKRLGENSLAIVFDSGKKGKNIVVRADIDALPIEESSTLPYSSKNSNISHKCGHDGHTAILSGLVVEFILNPINKGRVMLIFQSSEETGVGAIKVLADDKFEKFKPDFVFGFHNLPGKRKNKLFFKYNTFAMASSGVIIKLFGKASHAAEPEKGINPAFAISEIIKSIVKLSKTKSSEEFLLITLVHISLGEKSFGTSPCYGEIMLTVRSLTDYYLNKILKQINKLTANICKKYFLNFEIVLSDTFPSTINHAIAVDKLIETAVSSDFKFEILDEPYRWSEDFGHFLHKYCGAYFGLGAGENCPPLHSSDYDFPDEITENSINFLKTLVYNIQK